MQVQIGTALWQVKVWANMSVYQKLSSAAVKPGLWSLLNTSYNSIYKADQGLFAGRWSIGRLDANNMEDLYISPDGSKAYVLDADSTTIYHYTLQAPWIFSANSPTSTFNVGSQDSTPRGIFFKPDGTSMYMVGNNTDSVYRYDLGTAWDVSTASFVSSRGVSAEETSPQGLYFRSDGLKAYIVGSSGDDVNEYNLSVAWDFTTETFVGSFSVSALETTPRGIFFKPDGLKMYVTGSSGDLIQEYNLGTAWSVSTAVLSNTYDISSQTGTPRTCIFKDDGTVIYTLSNGFSEVYRTNLTVPWDLSTAEDRGGYSFFTTFSTDWTDMQHSGGSILFVADNSSKNILHYKIAPYFGAFFDSYVQKLDVSAQDNNLQGLAFNGQEGTLMYIAGAQNNRVYEYSLSVVDDLSTATFVRSFSFSAQTTNPRGLVFSDDGLSFFLGDNGPTKRILKYTLGTAWNISTASFDSALDLTSFVTTLGGFTANYRSFTSSLIGREFLVIDGDTSTAKRFRLAESWNLNTATFQGSLDLSDNNRASTPTDFKSLNFDWAGTRVLALNANGGVPEIHLYTLGGFSLFQQTVNPRSLTFSEEGSKMYVSDYTTDKVIEYTLGLAWNVATATFSTSITVPTSLEIVDAVFNPEGTKMYTLGNGESGVQKIGEFDLSTPWSLSTAVLNTTHTLPDFSIPAARGLTFKPDGTRIYIVGFNDESPQQGILFEYSLSIPWDISTASFVGFTDVTGDVGDAPQKILFKPDGTKAFFLNFDSDLVWEYSLSTPWDYSTADLANPEIFSVLEEDNAPTGLAIKNDGSILYVVGQQLDTVFMYDLVPKS